MRAVVFLVASVVLHDSIDTRRGPVTSNGHPSAQLLVKAANEQGSDDWEGRFLGTETHLFKAPVCEVDLVSPYSIVTVNFSYAVSHFKSVPSELPSPPPKG
jgi:hypothetical protein